MGAPAILDANAVPVLDMLNELSTYFRNRIIGGIPVFSDGGNTAQTTGANGVPVLDIDAAASSFSFLIDGQLHQLSDAAANIDSDAGAAVLFGATSGVGIMVTIVAESGTDNDTPAWFMAVGGVGTPASAAVQATDAAITASLGHSNWLRVANFLYNRDGDVSFVTLSDFDTSVQAMPDPQKFGVQFALADV